MLVCAKMDPFSICSPPDDQLSWQSKTDEEGWVSLELTLGELEKDVGTENKDKEREDEEKDKEAGSGEEMEDEDQGDKEHVGHFTSGKRESLQC